MKMKLKIAIFMAFLLSSCQQFAGEFEAEDYVMFQTLKYKEHCVSTLYIDGKYITRVINKNCRVYYENRLME